MRKRVVLFILIIGLLLAGCSTSVGYSTYKPAEIDMSGYRTIGILPFTPNYNFGNSIEVSLSPFLKSISFTIPANNPGRIARYATDEFYNQLVAERAFVVIPPDQLEAWFGAWGYGNQLNYFAEYLNIDAVVLGAVNNIDIDDNLIFRYEKNSLGVTEKKAYYRQAVEVTIDYMVVDTRTNRILARKQTSGSSSSEEHVPPRVELPRDQWYIYYKAPPLNRTYERAVAEAMKGVGSKMVPQEVRVSRFLKDEKDDPWVTQANEMAASGYYQQALHGYLQAWTKARVFAGGYNAAIMYELLRDYPNAIAQAEELLNYFYNTDSVKLLNELKRADMERKQVEEQLSGYVLLN